MRFLPRKNTERKAFGHGHSRTKPSTPTTSNLQRGLTLRGQTPPKASGELPKPEAQVVQKTKRQHTVSRLRSVSGFKHTELNHPVCTATGTHPLSEPGTVRRSGHVPNLTGRNDGLCWA